MKEILLIGNGPSATDYKMGKTVDKFPYVARFNTFRIHGFKEYVGTKCDVWITCDRFPQWQGLYDYKEIYFVSPVRDKVNHALLKIRTEIPEAKPFPVWVWDEVSKAMGCHPSSGALAAYYFSRSYDRVYLYGFDCFQADKHHYGDDNTGCHHKAEKERAFINKLLDGGIVRWFNNYTILHDTEPGYGTGGAFGKKILEFSKGRFVLDYGCGKGGLVRYLQHNGVDAVGYDPYVFEWRKKPPKISHSTTESFCLPDVIVSTDLLEHIPEDELDEVLIGMLDYKPDLMFHVVSNRKASQILPDGSNAHATIKDSDWWLRRFETAFSGYAVKQVEHNEKNNFTTYFMELL